MSWGLARSVDDALATCTPLNSEVNSAPVKRVGILTALLLCAFVGAQYPGAKKPPRAIAKGFESINTRDSRSILEFLAGPTFMGRNPADLRYVAAAGFVAGWLQQNGIEPGMPDGTYLQWFEMGRSFVEAANVSFESKVKDISLVFGDDFAVTAPADFDAELQFGFLRVPATGTLDGIDLASLKGRVVLLKTEGTMSRATREKLEREAGALQIVSALSDKSLLTSRKIQITKGSVQKLQPFTLSFGVEGAKRLADYCGAVAFSAPIVDKSSLEISDRALRLRGTTTFELITRTCNVVGKVTGSDDALKNEAVVIGSHLDHMGESRAGVRFGADDNASGCTANMMVARAMVLNRVKPKRTVYTAFWSSEELGLIGSEYFAANPPIPVSQVVSYLNMDMVGRNSEYSPWGDLPEYNETSVYASSARLNSPDLYALVLNANQYLNLLVRQDKDDRTMRSDTASFASRGVPTLKAFTGEHLDYHKPSDTPEKINHTKLVSVAKWIYICAHLVGSADSRPRFEEGWQYLTGKVTAMTESILDKSAVVEVSLVDISKVDISAVPMDTTVIRSPGKFPVMFAVKFKKAELNPESDYAIQVRVSEKGKLKWITTAVYRVLTKGGPMVGADVKVELVPPGRPR